MLIVKRFLIIVTGVLLSMRVYAADDRKLEMWEEPSHQLVFERQNTRILDIRIVPGVTSEFHSHRFATVYVVIQDALMQNQNHGQEWTARADRPYRSPGTLMNRADYVTSDTYHRVRNYDDKAFHLVSVVNSAAPTIGTGMEPVAGSDGYLKNPWVVEHRITLGPGDSSKQLKFANDSVLVQSHQGPAHVLENGVTHSVRSMPGAWSWHVAGSRFQVVNDSEKAREFILIEVKD